MTALLLVAFKEFCCHTLGKSIHRTVYRAWAEVTENNEGQLRLNSCKAWH